MQSELTVDGFRYLVNLHTTVRCLSINSNLVRIIGLRNIPYSILYSSAIKWSVELEKESNSYKERNGKLTEGGVPTTALKHYLTLSKELGLSQKLNDIYRISRLGKILYMFIQDKNPHEFELSNYEKLFYLLIIFLNDFDGASILLSTIIENESELSQKQLQELFVDKLKDRLLLKQKSSDTKTKHLLLEKYKKIEYTWQNPPKYSEHIITPRLDWLADLDLVDIAKTKGTNAYKISPFGKNLFTTIPTLTDNMTKDINEEWINTSLVKCLTMNYEQRFFWEQIDQNKQIEAIKDYLDLATKELSSIGSHRISFHTSFIFITILLFIKTRTVLEKKDLKELLLSKIQINDKIYSLHLAARKNEEYITFKYV